MDTSLERKIDGIKAYKGIPSLDIGKFRHPGWTTMAISIPRNSIKYRLPLEELNYNSIYIMYHSEENKIYVGQATSRESGYGVIHRLNEHKSDIYKDKWDKAFIFTSILKDEDGWTTSTLDILEHIYINSTFDINYNKKRESLKGVITSELEELTYQIQTYLCMFIPQLFMPTSDKMARDQESLIEEKISLNVKDLRDFDEENEVASLRNITTPEPTVREMVDMVKRNYELNHTLKIMDISCKGGEFLIEIFHELMNCDDPFLQAKSEFHRALYILDNQLYGIALSRSSFEETTELLYGEVTTDKNIVCLRNFAYELRKAFKISYTYGLQRAKELVFGVIFKDKLKTGDNVQDMKFDVVIGNPPYSDNESRGSTGSGNALYPYFMAAANAIARYSSLVVPSGWMIQYPVGVKHEIIDELRKSKHFVELIDYEDSYQIFQGVGIKAGICYYLMDNQNTYENCIHTVVTKDKESFTIDDMPLYDSDTDVCFRDRFAISMVGKIKNNKTYKFESFADKCAGAKHYFDDGKDTLTSVWVGYNSERTDYYNVKYFLKSNNRVHKGRCTCIDNCGMPNFGYAYINIEQVPRNKDDYKKHKVLMGEICNDDYRVMDIAQYIGNNSVCSQSYVPIFSPHNTEEECLNICKYIKTRFFRYLVKILKIGQHLGNRVYKLVPVQDFTLNSDINWGGGILNIEEQLYKKYKLSQEEIDYINKTIQIME